MTPALIRRSILVPLIAGLCAGTPAISQQITPFVHSMAVAAAKDEVLAAFYRESRYRPIWVGSDRMALERRAALLHALDKAEMHGLPRPDTDAAALRALMARATDPAQRAAVEVELTRVFLDLAAELSTGILTPSRVVPDIKRDIPTVDRVRMLADFAAAPHPRAFVETLPPSSQEYTRLVREKLKLERIMATGGWGADIPDAGLRQGASGPAVVALRDRLIAMGYLRRSATQVFDAAMTAAVTAFQADFGLAEDGIVGGRTLAEMNRPPRDRLGQILVSMERERWLNRDLGQKHIWVNLTDFRTRIVIDGETFFETKSVIGSNANGRRTPEFSDEMDHMVINPSWYVPRSIVVNEYLPALRSNPYAHGHMQLIDSRGRVVPRGRSLAGYSARSFPYSMKQPPSPRNALGLVKFMFPNKYNIYLHDTPSKSLFDRTVRAFSHGCIRLNDPFEFGYALLSLQTDDPEGEFQRHLRTGRESRVNLAKPLPVHIVYRTALTKPGGGMEYRDDIYGRDARILEALLEAGVALPAPQS
ncbi:murein L,D-transpeptidase [Palleronia sediminis]|uniref:Murein L,D-transpeptidase n=1 Tax=Palleronia sediminis TaxID=2547833 RepID=A0A4R6AKD6_9RHOB|nr:L,D-transpeptidase family protein [Palleronia sediminis]TDL83654.1 murein L,D-transpeptidase [Palleronia sediminis]